MKILIIEDETKTALYLKKGLQEHGFVVDISSNGSDGLHLAKSGHFDLLILDVMLPGKDGWSVLQALRTADKDLPVLFVTARDAVRDRVKGLQLGADDYLIKPFAFSELLERVRSLLRRRPVTQDLVLRLTDLEVDIPRHKVARHGKPLDLTPKEFLLLTTLLQRRGEVLSRTYLAEHVWDMSFDFGTNVVDVHIRRLRAKVDDSFPKKLIHTVRGVGYVLEERT